MTKKIILFSDGTNNQGGLGRDTNVWRLFRMLNCEDDEQNSFYDDGVGTESSTPKRLMGLAFGAGLTRNVKELYISLASHYVEGADIYLFGFSRGAFTVRLLANLIDYAGVPNGIKEHDGIDWKSRPADLDEWVNQAIIDYKNKINDLDGMYTQARLGESRRWQTDKQANLNRVVGKEVNIRCMGVWDSVNATGMPVDELRDLLLPHWVQDESIRQLPRCVKTGIHALAIDEARKTFAPTLWNEHELARDQYVEQVWFSGVHSNVGGGYPKDGMAHVSLEWMVKRLEQLDKIENHKFNHPLLSFNKTRSLLSATANVHDKIYDSRFGVGAFYRYQPRDINQVTYTASGNNVPVVHESVFDRINNATEFYAPFMIRNFKVANNTDTQFGHQQVHQVSTRHKDGDSRQDILHSVSLRVVLYWVFFITTVSLFSLPIVDHFFNIVAPGKTIPYLSQAILSLKGILPDVVSRWIDWYAGHPLILLSLLSLFVYQRMGLKAKLERRLSIVSSDLWHNLNRELLDALVGNSLSQSAVENMPKQRNVGKLNIAEKGIFKFERYLHRKKQETQTRLKIKTKQPNN